jgi:hypothetical protein
VEPDFQRLARWWGTLVIAILLFTVGVFGYIVVWGDMGWYRTDVMGAHAAMSQDMGEYVRVEGTVTLNATEDVVITEREVEKAIWTGLEYEYNVDYVWVEDGRGDPLLVIFDHVSVTKSGRHSGNYHKGDKVSIGGTVAVLDTGEKALRADFVAKHRNDTPARFVGYFAAAMFAGLLLAIVHLIYRLFLRPRKEVELDWRGT